MENRLVSAGMDAWVFTYSDAKKPTEYLGKYRPDLFIERHKSAI